MADALDMAKDVIEMMLVENENDSKAIKKTLSIPSWLNSMAEKAMVNFSQTLQDALMQKLNIAN